MKGSSLQTFCIQLEYIRVLSYPLLCFHFVKLKKPGALCICSTSADYWNFVKVLLESKLLLHLVNREFSWRNTGEVCQVLCMISYVIIQGHARMTCQKNPEDLLVGFFPACHFEYNFGQWAIQIKWIKPLHSFYSRGWLMEIGWDFFFPQLYLMRENISLLQNVRNFILSGISEKCPLLTWTRIHKFTTSKGSEKSETVGIHICKCCQLQIHLWLLLLLLLKSWIASLPLETHRTSFLILLLVLSELLPAAWLAHSLPWMSK